MKKIVLSLVILSILSLSLFPFLTSAQESEPTWIKKMKGLIKDTVIIEEEKLEERIFRTIRYLLSFLGVIAVLIIIYGGFTWMTAAGNEEKVKKAKSMLQNGIIGLVIIILAYAITIFIFKVIRR